MLIEFSVSNFLSFNSKETVSMIAGKARKFSERLYKEKRMKLTKCEIVLGANASGKSNLIYAFEFIQDLILDGLPTGFSDKYYRLNPNNKTIPSEFEIKILCDSKVFRYGFSVMLATGSIIKESLYDESTQKLLFNRDTRKEAFQVGHFFKQSDAITKLISYGEDSSNDDQALFLTIINKNKGKMFADFPELNVFRSIYNWFAYRLSISFPESILTGYPFFTSSNLDEIAEILNALGTGVSNLKMVELPADLIKSKMPADIYKKIISDLEKENIRRQSRNEPQSPQIMVRSYKEFYTFEIDTSNHVTITTIEFSHENESVFFNLNEESDGTARLLDLIEILFRVSDNRIFIIDEIDRCLHPAMTVKMMRLFLDMAEKRNTQLIITSHESRLLAEDILRNDEICFVTKDSLGASTINPLEKYQLRADKKVYAALFDGTLSVMPNFDDTELKKILGT